MTSGDAGVRDRRSRRRSRGRAGRSRSSASSASIVACLTRGSFVWPASSVVFWWTKTNVVAGVEPLATARVGGAGRPRSRRSRAPRSARARSAAQAAQERRLADERPAEAVSLLEERRHRVGRPHHLSVITLKRSPYETGCDHDRRVHSSAARRGPLQPRARRPAAAAPGCRSRKNASVSVTRGSAPPETRRTASPRQTCVSENVRPSTSIPSQRSTSAAASSSSSSGSGRPVSHSRRRAARRAQRGVREHVLRRSPPARARAPRTPRDRGTRPAGSRASPSARPRSTARARDRPRRGRRRALARRAGRGSASCAPRSRCGRRATSCARSPSPSSRTTTIG